MADFHCHHSHSLRSSRNLCAIGEFSCAGLKGGLFFNDAETRVFRSTYRATHCLIAGIAACVSPYDEISGRLHSFSNARRLTRSEIGIDVQQVSVSSQDDVVCGVRQNCSSREHCDVRISKGCIDSPSEEEKLVDFDHSESWRSHPSTSSLDSLAIVPPAFQSGVDIPMESGFHASYLEIQEPYGVSEFCKEQPEASLTPDLQSEVKIWYCEEVKEANYSLSATEHVCNRDEDDRQTLVLALEEDVMPASLDGCTTGRSNAWQSDKECTGSNYLSGLSTGSSNAQQSEKLCRDDNFSSGPSFSAFDCWRGVETNLSFCAHRQSTIRKLFTHREILALDIFGGTAMQKLAFQSLLALQELVQLLKWRKFDEVAGMLIEQLMVNSRIYLKLCRRRHRPANAERAVDASTCKEFFLAVNTYARRLGHYEVNAQITVQDHPKCDFGGQWNLLSNHLLPDQDTLMGILQVSQCGSILSSMVGIDSAFGFSHLSSLREDRFSRNTESSSELINDFGEVSTMSAHKDLGVHDSGQLNHMSSSGTGSCSALKLPDLLGGGDGGMAVMVETSYTKMDELKEEPKETSRLPSWRRINQVDDWTTLPADKVDKCLDTCLYKLQHHMTPELELLDLTVRGDPSEFVHSYNSCLVEVVCPNTDFKANIKGNSISGLPCGPMRTQSFASLSSIREELRTPMPYRRLLERQSKRKLEHFAEGFLLRRNIIHQQRNAQKAPPFPPRDPTGSIYKHQGASGPPLGDVKSNPYTHFSNKASIENCNELEMALAPSAMPCGVALSFPDHNHLVGGDVIIDIVGLMNCIESQYCSQLKTIVDGPANPSKHTDLPLIGSQVFPKFSAVIVTIIAVVVYTRSLLEGGLAWVEAQAQREEDN